MIAVAELRGATVVTGEGDNGNATRPKIPFICAARQVPCLNLVGLIKEERWQFN